MDRAKLHAWLNTQIDERQPPAQLEEGMGQSIMELALALGALENDRGMVFGMYITAEENDLAPFARKARSTLLAWCKRMGETHGDEGIATVTTIAARCNIVLDSLQPHANVQRVATPFVAQFVAALGDHAMLEQRWRAAGSLDDDDFDLAVRVEVGLPDPDRLAHVMQIAHEAFGFELPASYVELLRTYNGVSVGAVEDPEPAEVVSVEARQLSEPVIWPAEVYGDHFQLDAVPLAGLEHAFVFGELADSGMLVLEAADPGPIFWLPRRFAGSEPIRLANSFDEFLSAFAGSAASVPQLLKRAGVPGWGE
ncbi:MAG: hypothetical protein JWP01_436 [Myxococcales bacterium]|nr:hypothetical protein [Myxococcales bacterium]